MKKKNLFTWLLALATLMTAPTACSSGSSNEPDRIETQVSSDLAGTWDFPDFTLTLDQKERGVVEYDKDGSFKVSSTTRSSGTTTRYEVFTYSYNVTRGVLTCTCTDGKSFTISGVHLDNGKLVVTYGEGDSEKTATGTKHVYTALEQGKFMGKWYLEGNEYLYFTATGVVLYGNEQNSGTWRTDGYSVWTTVNGKETEMIRNVTMQGDVMKALVMCDGKTYWQPLSLYKNDKGGNSGEGGGDSKETIDDGNSSGSNKPNDDDGKYWGE